MTDAPVSLRMLLVEDNPADVYLTRLMLDRIQASIELTVASDGARALDLLGLGGERAHLPLPDVILLDLNLPKVDGWELLRRLKTDAALRTIPVIILSSACSQTEVKSCYDLHANAFVTKRGEPQRMEGLLRSLAEFWFRTVSLPQC